MPLDVVTPDIKKTNLGEVESICFRSQLFISSASLFSSSTGQAISFSRVFATNYTYWWFSAINCINLPEASCMSDSDTLWSRDRKSGKYCNNCIGLNLIKATVVYCAKYNK